MNSNSVITKTYKNNYPSQLEKTNPNKPNLEPTPPVCLNSYSFTGRRLDILDAGSLKIMYYRARYYDPTTGRFISRNPLGVDPAGGKNNPFAPEKQYMDGMSLYEYVKSQPIVAKDPLGTYTKEAMDLLSSFPPTRLCETTDCFDNYKKQLSHNAKMLSQCMKDCGVSPVTVGVPVCIVICIPAAYVGGPWGYGSCWVACEFSFGLTNGICHYYCKKEQGAPDDSSKDALSNCLKMKLKGY